MNLDITFLGTGTSTGIPQLGCKCDVCMSDDEKDQRLRASVLVETEGKRILIDCGPDFRQQMLRNRRVNHLDGILITHGHYDHIGGLDDIRPFGDTTVYAEKNVLEQIKTNLPYCFSANKYPGVPEISLSEIGEDEVFDVTGIDVMPVRVMHAKLPILGFRIGSLAYLTDVKTIDDKNIEKLKGLDVLVLNALRIAPHMSHISLSEALQLAAKIGAKKTYFTHFSHDLGKYKYIEQQLPENIHLSYDQLRLTV